MDKYQEFKKITEPWKLLVAADIVVFGLKNKQLQVLLVKRKFEPGVGQWAIPGGFVREDESLEQAALRELAEETGLKKGVYLEQLYTFGDVNRDPRMRVIATTYMVLIDNAQQVKLKAGDDAAEAEWFPITKLPELSFGKAHEEALLYAWQRLKWKFEYTNVAFSMLPPLFTLTDLQKLYEAVYNYPLDKRNFRKKIMLLKLVASVDEFKKEFGRPAQLFRAAGKGYKVFNKIV